MLLMMMTVSDSQGREKFQNSFDDDDVMMVAVSMVVLVVYEKNDGGDNGVMTLWDG